jgi:hypothetical protein
MTETPDHSQIDFARLLRWLDPDRDLAGKRYEEIHTKLTRWFSLKGCDCPEDLTDIAIDRLTRKLDTLAPFAPGDQQYKGHHLSSVQTSSGTSFAD